MMKVDVFIRNFREAFGESVELPIAFYYSDTAVSDTEKINGCFFKGMKEVRNGQTISLNCDNIGCGGGKFYTGFTEMPEFVPTYVSLKERYKKTPEMVLDFVNNLGVCRTEKNFLNFTRIDQISSFDGIEGILFFATPDVLSGLTTWTYFDNNAENAVTSMFASGCSATVTQAVNENKIKGRRTFLGFFDPSARPFVDEHMLSFVIPMARFQEMYHTMRESALFDTHAWGKVRARINSLSTEDQKMSKKPLV